MKLVVNADDFALTKGVTYGILEANEKGILTSTTALVNSKWFKEAMDLAGKYSNLGIGVHLNLTIGKPLTDASSLVDPNTGLFYRRPDLLFRHDVSYDDIYSEWKCQIDSFIEWSGMRPDHLDSHHFVTEYNEKTESILTRLCEEYHLPARKDGTFYFTDEFYSHTVTKQDFMQIVQKKRRKNLEVMTHPGWCDLELFNTSSYSLRRVEELEILCSDQIKEFIENNPIELVHY